MHVLGEHNGKKTEFQTNTKSQGLVPAHFALIIIIIVVHVVQSISINKYMQNKCTLVGNSKYSI